MLNLFQEVNVMVTKMTVKNQVTIPKQILERAGLAFLQDDERYFEVNVQNHAIVLKPVTITIEERIPEEQLEKFENWAVRENKGDEVCDSRTHAVQFLKKRVKNKK